MAIHDDAENARRKVYDDAFTGLNARITSLTTERDRAITDLTATRTELAEANNISDDLRDTVTALETEIATLEARIEELESQAPTNPPTQNAPGLPFPVDAAALAASDKKWLDHYFPVFPLTWDNAPIESDTYQRAYLNRDGENGKHSSYGGYLRDRKISNAPYAGSNWRREAAAEEIRYAQRYLRDGFFVNLMSTSHANTYNAMRDEANANFPGFLIVPMVDCNGSISGYQSGANLATQSAILASTTLVNTVASFLTTRNTWTLTDGSVIVASYKANGRNQAWWADFAAKLKTATGKNVRFVHVYNNSPSSSEVSSRPSYASGAWAVGADPGVYAGTGSSTTYKNAGTRLLFGVQPQNVRPGTGYGPWFDEACNTEALRAGIRKAIDDGAGVIQGVTWDDLTEGGHFAPSVMRGTAALELSAKGIVEWKTGTKPVVTEDYMVISHRNQTLDAEIVPPQSVVMGQNTSRTNRSPVRNKVEVYTDLTAPATITVKVGGTNTTYQAPAGEYAYLVDARPGNVEASTSRGLTVKSPIAIRSRSGNQDRQYCMVSSHGPTNRQYDPTPTA